MIPVNTIVPSVLGFLAGVGVSAYVYLATRRPEPDLSDSVNLEDVLFDLTRPEIK